MPKTFEFPDSTIFEAPDDTTDLEAVRLYDALKSGDSLEAPSPDDRSSFLNILGEPVGGLVRGAGGILESVANTFGVARRLGISLDTKMALDKAEQQVPLSIDTLQPTEEGLRGLRERKRKILENDRVRKYESIVTTFTNLVAETGKAIQKFPLGKLPEDIERASVVMTFEEEGVFEAGKLFLRKTPSVLGEQGANFAFMLSIGAGASSASILGRIAPKLMKRGFVKQTAGRITGQMIAGGSAAGLLEAGNTLQTALGEGGSDEQAAKAFTEMFFGTAVLNSLGLGPFFKKIPKGARVKLQRLLLASGAEGITEGLEEFVDADALERAGIRKADFKQTIRNAIEAAMFGALVGGVVNSLQQGANTFSGETELEMNAKQFEKIARVLEKAEVVDEEELSLVKKLRDAKTKEDYEEILRVSPENIGSFEDLKKLSLRARIGLEVPRPIDEEGNIIYELSDETFTELAELGRQPGEALDVEASEVLRAFMESIIVVNASSRGITPEKFVEETFAGIEFPGGSLKARAGEALDNANRIAEVNDAIGVLQNFFEGEAAGNFNLQSLGITFAASPALSRASRFLVSLGFNMSTLVGKDGTINKEAALVKLGQLNDELISSIAEEEVRLDKRQSLEEQLEEEAPPGLEQVAPKFVTSKEIVEPISEPVPTTGPVNSTSLKLSSADTLKIEDDFGSRPNKEMSEELKIELVDYKRQLNVQKRKLKKAEASNISSTILNHMDETAAIVASTELRIDDSSKVRLTALDWMERMERVSFRNRDANLSLLKLVRQRFIAHSKEEIETVAFSLEQAKAIMADVIISKQLDGVFKNRVLTPDGSTVSMLTATQAMVTRTKAFKNWFGKSKVVDANGEPLLMFHGTRIVKFAPINEFFPRSHFGTAKAALDRAGLGIGSNIIPVFLRIENPIEVVDESPFDDVDGTRRILVKALPHKEKEIEDIVDIFDISEDVRDAIERLVNLVKREGFDGAVYINQGEDKGSTSYVAFNPEQAKSLHNRGTYSLKEGNFLHSREAGILRGRVVGISKSGAVMDFKKASKFLIRGFQASNMSTAIHELWHFAALTVGGDLKVDIEKAMSSKNELARGKITKIQDWSKDRHERFAKSGERYLVLGVAPNKEWEGAFYIIREKLALAYQSMRNYALPLMNPEVQRVLDHYFLAYSPGKTTGEINERLNQIDKLTNSRDDLGALDQKTGDSLGKYYANINMTRYDDDPVMKKIVLRILDRLGGIESVSDAEVLKEALDLLDQKGTKVLVKDLQSILDDGVAMDDVEIMAASIIKDRIEATVYNLIQNGKARSAEYTRAVEELSDLLQIQQGAGNQAGRILRMMKSFGPNAEQMEHFLNQLTEADPEFLARLAELNINDPEAIKLVFKKMDNIGRRMLITLYLTNMLSSPVTQSINLMSTFFYMASMVPVRFGAASIERAHAKVTGQRSKMYMGEGLFLLNSLVTTPFRRDGKAWRVGWDAFTKRIDIQATDDEFHKILTRYDETVGISALSTFDHFFEVFDTSKTGLSPEAMMGKLARFGRQHPIFRKGITYGSNLPTRLLFAFDMWMKTIIEIGEEGAINYRLEQDANAQIGDSTTNENILEAQIEHEKTMLSNTYNDALSNKLIIQEITGTTLSEDAMKREALIESYIKRRAEEGTFQTEVSKDGLTAWAIKQRQKRPIIGTIFFPFIRTISNITHAASEFIPGAPIVETAYDKWVARDKQGIFARVTPAELATKQMMGMFLIFMLWELYDKELLTGPPPDDEGKRLLLTQTGWKPFSVKVGKRYIEYRRFDPFGTVAALAATFFVDVDRLIKDDADPARKERDLFEKFWFVASDVSQAFSNSTFAQGAFDLLGTATGAVKGNRAERTIARFGSSLIPYSSFWRWVNNNHNQAEFGGQPVENDADIANYLSRSLPFSSMFYSQREPGIDFLGQKIVRQTQGEERGFRRFMTNWTPFNYSILSIDELEAQFIEVEYYPRPPDRVVNLPGVGRYRLDEDIYIEYATEGGHQVKEKLLEMLSRLKKMEKEKKDIALRRIISRVRQRTLSQAKKAQLERISEGR